MKILLVIAILLNTIVSQARVFDFNGESLAAYLHLTGGLASIGDDAYADSSGLDTVITETVPYNPGFELGFLFGIAGAVVIKLGAEVLQTKQLPKISGKNASGDERFTLDSKVFGFNPNLALEFNIDQDNQSRFFFAANVGSINISVDNAYTFNAKGLSELSVTGDYTEKSEASFLTYGAYLGYEMLAVDNVTFMMNVGYRHIPVPELKYKHDYPDLIDSQSALKGDVVLNSDGSTRKFDFGGPYVGLGFRFYINFL